MLIKGNEIAKIYQLYISDNLLEYNDGKGYLFTNQDIFKEQIQNIDFKVSQDFRRKYDNIIKRDLWKSLGTKIDFNITRRIFGSYCEATIRLYNVSFPIREVLAQDLYDKNSVTELKRNIFLLAGHKTDIGVGAGMGLLFSGNTFYIRNYKQGVDVITEIYARGSEWNINQERPKILEDLNPSNNKTLKQLISELCDKLKTTDDISTNKTLMTKIGDKEMSIFEALPDEILKSNIVSRSESIFEIIKEYCPLGYIPFIDNQQLYILKSTQIIINDVFTTLAHSDIMVETPKRDKNNVLIKAILLPFVRLGQQMQISSQITSKYNGIPFKVLSIVHSGTINDLGESRATTQIELINTTGINFKTDAVKKIEENKLKSLVK